MKKILLILLMIGSFAAAFSQNDVNRTKGRLGLMISPGITWLSPETNGIEKGRNRFGMSYGIIGDIKILNSDNYFFSTGLGFSLFGGDYEQVELLEIDNNQVEGVANNSLKMRQIEVPLTIKMVSSEIGYTSLYAQFGMSLGFITRGLMNQEFTAPNVSLNREDLEVLNSETHAMRAALIFGGGVEYNMVGNLKWFVGAQYSNGFTNLLKGNYYELDNSNNIVFEGGEPKQGPKYRAQSNIVSLNLGLIF